MQTSTSPFELNDKTKYVWHPTTPADQAAMAAMRAIVEPNKGRLRGIGARVPFDAIIGRVAAPTGVDFRPDTVGGVPGWWCAPKGARPDGAILHFHGGWFNWGSAEAFQKLVGHIAASAGVPAFIPDYRLAPEHPYPAANADAQACYAGLIELGFTKIAITGDSAGGNLALGLLAARGKEGSLAPVAAVVLSPVTDLTLSGESWESRADADPFFLRVQALELVTSYLNNHDPADPLVSPLFGNLTGLPPLRVHVGNDEVLLDDSIRYVDRAIAVGIDAKVDVWEGMAHGFLSGVGAMDAPTQALKAIGEFLKTHVARTD